MDHGRCDMQGVAASIVKIKEVLPGALFFFLLSPASKGWVECTSISRVLELPRWEQLRRMGRISEICRNTPAAQNTMSDSVHLPCYPCGSDAVELPSLTADQDQLYKRSWPRRGVRCFLCPRHLHHGAPTTRALIGIGVIPS